MQQEHDEEKMGAQYMDDTQYMMEMTYLQTGENNRTQSISFRILDHDNGMANCQNNYAGILR